MGIIAHMNSVAARKLGGVSPTFKWYSWQCIGPDAVKVSGAETLGVYAKGRRKGQTKYAKPSIDVIVTEAEERAEYDRFERETGQCAECLGTGLVFAGWSAAEGTKRRTCSKCGGTAKADGNDPVERSEPAR